MARYVATVEVDGDAAAMYEYLADFRTVAEWDPGVAEAALVAGVAGTAGAEYHVVSKFLGRSLPLTYRLKRAAPPSAAADGLIELVAETDDFTSWDVITITNEARPVVVYDATLTLKGVRRVFEPGLRVMFQIIGHRAEAGLRESLNQLAPATT